MRSAKSALGPILETVVPVTGQRGFRSKTTGAGVWLLLTLLLVFVPAGLTAQEAPQELADLFGESLDVRVVNLEVVVEQRGDRVFGLDVDDFELKVDGERIPIEFFSEIRGGAGVSPTAADVAIPAVQEGQRVGTRYLVFIDDLFTVKPYRNRVLRTMQDDLERLQPEDSMAVVAYGGGEIDLLTSWTRSTRDLKRVLNQAQDRPSYGLRQRSLNRFNDEFRASTYGYGAFGRFGRLGLDRAGGLYGPYSSAFRGSRGYAEISEVVAAASSTLRAFAQPEGRKVLIMLSGSWPVALDGVPSESSVRYGGAPGRRLFSPLVDTANRLGYTLYPVDVAGVETRFADASYGSLREANFVQELSREREWAQEGNLVTLARETGGRALLDGASSAVLEKVSDDTRSYYSIGFTPTWRADDTRHRVELDVPGLKRAKVRARRSFSDLSAQTQSSMRLESAQLFNLPMPGAGKLAVSPGIAESKGWRKVVMPLEVEIPLDGLSFLPTGEGYAAQVELRVAVTDDRGDRADIPVIPLLFKRSSKPSGGETETYVAHLKMRDRPHRVLVSVLDPVSGEELSARLDVLPRKDT